MRNPFFSHFFKLISIIVLFTLILGPLGVYAYSQEVTGLSLNSNVQNNGIYVKVGIYYIFATDKRILFYALENNLAVLKKTWDIPFQYLTGVTDGYRTCIIPYNSSNIIVVGRFMKDSNTYLYLNAFILNINTLSYSTIFANNVDGETHTAWLNEPDGMTIWQSSATGNIYLIFQAYSTGNPKTYIARLTPSYSLIGTYSGKILFGPTLFIPSQTDNNKGYIITRNEKNGLRYKIYKIDFVSFSITYIGQGGNDNDYSSYVYQVAYKYNNVSGHLYYNVLIAYPHLSVNTNIRETLIRFNDTYINEWTQSVSVSSSINFLRSFTVVLQLGATPSNLVNGFYDYVFVGLNYYFKYMSFKLENIETETPSLTPYGDIESYQNKRHYYTGIANVGGIQDVYSNIGLELDYSNNKAVADTFVSYSVNFTYTYEVWNSTNKLSAVSGIFQIKQNTNYWFKAWLKANNVSDVQGYWKVFSDKNQYSNNTLWRTGIMLNSYMEFSFQYSDIGDDYWILQIYPQNYQISGNSLDFYHRFYVLSKSITIVKPGEPIDVLPPLDYGIGLFVNSFVPFVLILVPTILLASVLGIAGAFIGLILGVTLLAWSGAVPLWVVVVLVFGIIVAMISRERGR